LSETLPDTYRDIAISDVIHFTGFDGNEYDLPQKLEVFLVGTVVTVENGELHIKNQEGTMIAKIGDYLVKDQDGNVFPVEPRIIKQMCDEQRTEGR
jgi:hypothetical protein